MAELKPSDKQATAIPRVKRPDSYINTNLEVYLIKTLISLITPVFKSIMVLRSISYYSLFTSLNTTKLILRLLKILDDLASTEVWYKFT